MVVKKGEYDKDFMKITFDTDYNLPLNKQLNLHMFLKKMVNFICNSI